MRQAFVDKHGTHTDLDCAVLSAILMKRDQNLCRALRIVIRHVNALYIDDMPVNPPALAQLGPQRRAAYLKWRQAYSSTISP